MTLRQIEHLFSKILKGIRIISIVSSSACLLSIIAFLVMLLSSEYSKGAFMIGYIPAFVLVWGIIPCVITLIILIIYRKSNKQNILIFFKKEIKLLSGSILSFGLYLLIIWISTFWIIPYE
jgi:hypothetical protein